MSIAKCEECHIGHCHPVELTYMRNLGPHMVVVPEAPASKCDMCGCINFDPGFLLTMQAILYELVDNQRQGGRTKSPIADRYQEWTPVGKGS